MFAQLGTIQFNTLKTFKDYSERGSANFAEHALLDGKPRLQKTGNSLTELSISVLLHHSFCDVKAELNNFKTARDNGEILPLIWGNGDVEGDFVLTDLDISTEEKASEGTLLSCLVSLSLKEFTTPDKLQAEQNQNRQKAKAVGNKKPVAKKKTNSKTCPQMVSSLVSKIKSNAAIVDHVYSVEGGPGQQAQKDRVRQSCVAVSNYCATIIQSNGECLTANPDVKTKAGEVKQNAEAVVVSIQNTAGFLYSFVPNQNLQTKVKELDASARKLIQQTMTRK